MKDTISVDNDGAFLFFHGVNTQLLRLVLRSVPSGLILFRVHCPRGVRTKVKVMTCWKYGM